MRQSVGGVCCFFAMFLLIPAMLLVAFQMAVLNNDAHMALYARFGAKEAAGLTQEGLSDVSAAIVDYLRGNRDDLNVSALLEGENRQVFNERELTHMEDVRRLFDLSRRVIFVCFSLSAVFLLLSLLLRRARVRIFRLGGLAILLWLALFSGVLIIASRDFSGAFDTFHRLLFTNDLWMLNPRTDRMIRMMPEAFFLALAARAAVYMGVALVACLLAFFGADRMGRRYLK